MSKKAVRYDRWEFPRDKLKRLTQLGEGEFGVVWKYIKLGINRKEGTSIVAVKTLKKNATKQERENFLSELKIMKTLDPHPNIVRLLGCCTEKNPIFLIMEYLNEVELQTFLRIPGQILTSRVLTSFAYEVAKGMAYLSSKKIIHRDLAARNILLTENHTCKVADFGFARNVKASNNTYETKSNGKLPTRWMAPESLLDNIYTIKSDVWSFGVLIWEIFTLGWIPYPDLSNEEVISKVQNGGILDKPLHCKKVLYDIMRICWKKHPKRRPSFSKCVQSLEELYITETQNFQVDLSRYLFYSLFN